MRPHNDVFQQFTDSCFRGKGATDKRRTKQESLEACRVRRRIEAHGRAKELGVTLEDLGMQ